MTREENIKASEDFIKAGIAKECTECPDFCEEDCIKNAECAKGNDGFEGCKTVKDVMEVKQYFDTDCLELNDTIIAKIENINHCPYQNTCCIVSPFVHCNYNYKSDSCIKAHKNFINDCEQVHKQMKARRNPEWHHVNLETLRNIDFGMIDEKRRCYMKVYRMTVNFINAMYKCNKLSSIDNLRRRLISKVEKMWVQKVITYSLVNYVKAKIDNCYLVNGLLSSTYASSYSDKPSRTYKKTFYI